MESLLELLEPLTRLICTAVAIVLFFLFVVQPLLKYLIVNREIERRKKQNEEMLTVNSLHDGGSDDDSGEKEIPAAGAVGQGLRASESEKDTLDRLAASDPDKAGNLVKKWVNND